MRLGQHSTFSQYLGKSSNNNLLKLKFSPQAKVSVVNSSAEINHLMNFQSTKRSTPKPLAHTAIDYSLNFQFAHRNPTPAPPISHPQLLVCTIWHLLFSKNFHSLAKPQNKSTDISQLLGNTASVFSVKSREFSIHSHQITPKHLIRSRKHNNRKRARTLTKKYWMVSHSVFVFHVDRLFFPCGQPVKVAPYTPTHTHTHTQIHRQLEALDFELRAVNARSQQEKADSRSNDTIRYWDLSQSFRFFVGHAMRTKHTQSSPRIHTDTRTASAWMR